jgi:hypothetical protein
VITRKLPKTKIPIRDTALLAKCVILLEIKNLLNDIPIPRKKKDKRK